VVVAERCQPFVSMISSSTTRPALREPQVSGTCDPVSGTLLLSAVLVFVTCEEVPVTE